jgi:leucyl-tRNA synthetase
MEYDFRAIETKWQAKWKKLSTYQVKEVENKPKFYVLDMFPYPSGAGLHVGHPLGYIASDIFARYKKLQGYNVLHPMGYDSFGLPAEQYAIQTGQHPAITTQRNIERYRSQLDRMGFSYDWSREVRTSDPEYYKWTQWIFSLIYNAWYNIDTNRAEPIETLIGRFENNGNYNVNAAIDSEWFSKIDRNIIPFFSPQWKGDFSAVDWMSLNSKQQQHILMHYRLAYLADSVVNWCPALGTVLANDEIKDGVSERGGYPVEQKLMKQWSMRISAYAERLLQGLESIDWPESVKEIQRNWIGKSEGAMVRFALENSDHIIEVFTTRPDTIFGVSFITLAPEHPLVPDLTTQEQQADVSAYVHAASLKTERDRQADVKTVSGTFTGSYALHPFTGEKVPVWIGEYVLAGYGTGAVMAVPAGDQRDWDFAKKFDLPIPEIFEHTDILEKANTSKEFVLKNSDFLNGMDHDQAIKTIIGALEQDGKGEGKTNYRLRDAVFSRQRYWGEPFPVYYKDGTPHLVPFDQYPVVLPEIDKYEPTTDGLPPLARSTEWTFGDEKYPMELNTMPGWAGSSWYFLRYMDPQNQDDFVAKDKADYWGQVDLYMGGAEHATGHLLYARFWTSILYDLGYLQFQEPFKKLINQGMIQGRSNHVYRIVGTNKFVTLEKKNDYQTQQLYVDVNIVHNDKLDLEAFRNWLPEYRDAEFILNDHGEYTCSWAVDKMSKRWFNVVNPDDLCESFGADTFRAYEMFLGPVEQHKPWDTKGINGVHNFLRKFWRLFHDKNNDLVLSDNEPELSEWKILHKTIKKVTDDLNRYSWNTVVSTLMIAVNELQELACNKKKILEPLCILLSPYAPHITEELWEKMGNTSSIHHSQWPIADESYLVESEFAYPISFNGKTRFFVQLPLSLSQSEVANIVMSNEQTIKLLEGKEPKKVIVVPGRIVNVVV